MLIRDNRPLCYPFDERMLVSVPRVPTADGEETDATPAGVAILPGFNMYAIMPKGLERYHCAPNVWTNVSDSPYLAGIGTGERRWTNENKMSCRQWLRARRRIDGLNSCEAGIRRRLAVCSIAWLGVAAEPVCETRRTKSRVIAGR